MLYIAVDIGCIECGEESAVLGVFSSSDEAHSVCAEHEGRQTKNWSGQHSFEVFEVPATDVVCHRHYK